MKKVIPICQEHPDEELRLEYLVDENNHGYTSAFCLKCAKHYILCNKTRYMDSCVYRNDHDGQHCDSYGNTWFGEHSIKN